MNRGLDCFALTLVIIGAVNWGLIGFFQLDLVAWLFGNLSWISRIIYALVGLCGLYMLSFYGHYVLLFFLCYGILTKKLG